MDCTWQRNGTKLSVDLWLITSNDANMTTDVTINIRKTNTDIYFSKSYARFKIPNLPTIPVWDAIDASGDSYHELHLQYYTWPGDTMFGPIHKWIHVAWVTRQRDCWCRDYKRAGLGWNYVPLSYVRVNFYLSMSLLLMVTWCLLCGKSLSRALINSDIDIWGKPGGHAIS